ATVTGTDFADSASAELQPVSARPALRQLAHDNGERLSVIHLKKRGGLSCNPCINNCPNRFVTLKGTWNGLSRLRASEPRSVTPARCRRSELFTTPWSRAWRKSFST